MKACTGAALVQGIIQRGVPVAPCEKAAPAKLRFPAKTAKVYPEHSALLGCHF